MAVIWYPWKLTEAQVDIGAVLVKYFLRLADLAPGTICREENENYLANSLMFEWSLGRGFAHVSVSVMSDNSLEYFAVFDGEDLKSRCLYGLTPPVKHFCRRGIPVELRLVIIAWIKAFCRPIT